MLCLDGLQNQDAIVPAELKVQFIDAATEAGTALANCVAALRAGVTQFDASAGGVGGRPRFIEGTYPKVMGLTGSACTEDLVAMLEEMGVRTGIDLARLLELGRLTESVLGRELLAHVVKTGLVRY